MSYFDRIKIVDADGHLLGIDALGALCQMPIEHHMVHKGNFYTVVDYDADVDIAGPKYWHIITPDTVKRIHIVLQISASGAGLVEFFENPTTTDNGTVLTAYNNDRNSGNSTTALFYYDPTVAAGPLDGTRIQVDEIGTYNNKTKVGGTIRQQAEFILKQNEQYLLKFTTIADDNIVSFLSEFYEV